MNNKLFRLGIVADLSPGGLIHQQTFIRAVEQAAEQLHFERSGIELIWENDRATYTGGDQSAQVLVRKQVDAVLGHYASAAAKGALPHYETRRIPVLLPAATADFLTTDFSNAFRLCGRDADLVNRICETLLARGVRELYIGHDDSVHGRALSSRIEAQLRGVSDLRLRYDVARSWHIVYVGSYVNSLNFAQGLRARSAHPHAIYFTDDVVHPKLAHDLVDSPQEIYAFGYASARDCPTAVECVSAYRARWGKAPNTYFLETYAAMEVVQQLVDQADQRRAFLDQLRSSVYRSVLGEVQFDERGESGFQRFALWQLYEGALRSDPRPAIMTPSRSAGGAH